jgi:hypothetical protein
MRNKLYHLDTHGISLVWNRTLDFPRLVPLFLVIRRTLLRMSIPQGQEDLGVKGGETTLCNA